MSNPSKLEVNEWRETRKNERGAHPRATMQKHEKKEVAGGASWKLLKIKRQICGEECKERKSESQMVSDG